jgi:hypothetical protein
MNVLWFYRWSVGGSSVVGRGLTGQHIELILMEELFEKRLPLVQNLIPSS